MSVPPRFVADAAVMLGKPTVRGTRITVEHILEGLADGFSVEDVLAAHPHPTREDVQPALAFAVEAVRLEGITQTSIGP